MSDHDEPDMTAALTKVEKTGKRPRYSLSDLEAQWEIGNTRAERKAKEDRTGKLADGRSLRATGRTAQFNFKCREDIKKRTQAIADELEIKMAVLMEDLLEKFIAEHDKRGPRNG
jgi:hypothetical protein